MPINSTWGTSPWSTTSTASTTIRYDPWPDWFGNGTASATTTGVSMQVNQQVNQQQQEEDDRWYTRYQLACEKAKALFKELLTTEQLVQLEDRKYVDLVGSEGNFYRINCFGSHVGNVLLLDEDQGNEIGRFCCHGPERENGRPVPPFDHFITQLLFLRADESLFIRTANVHLGGPAYRLQDQFINARRAAEQEGYREIARSQAVDAA